MGRNWLTKSYPSGTLLNINGIDGCKAGWLTVKSQFVPATGTHSDPALFVHEKWEKTVIGADLIAVDMPIGMVEFGKRPCDHWARKKLGKKKSSSVFSPPRRGMLQFETYQDANRFGKAQGPRESHGGGLSKQAWNITPKIKQIDDWITPKRQERVFEAHPELAFAALNGGEPLPSKKSDEGQSARKQILQTHGFGRVIESAKDLPRRIAALDDVLDAAVLCLVGGRIALGSAVCLGNPDQRDAKNLAMEIWY